MAGQDASFFGNLPLGLPGRITANRRVY
jgi:hypothetical protein